MARAKPPSHEAMLNEARERAAKELSLPTSDYRVQKLALLTTAFDAQQALVAAGAKYDTSELLSVVHELDACRRELKLLLDPVNLKVSFVSGVVGMFKCSACNAENRIENYVGPEPKPAPVYASIADHAKMTPVPPPKPKPVDPEQQKADLAASRRQEARTTAGICPPVQSPRINYNYNGNSDGGSCSDLMRRIENSYR